MRRALAILVLLAACAAAVLLTGASESDGAKGKIQFFIPDPQATLTSGTLAAEGVAVDAAGNIYGAEVGPAKLQKYVRKK